MNVGSNGKANVQRDVGNIYREGNDINGQDYGIYNRHYFFEHKGNFQTNGEDSDASHGKKKGFQY